jgi:hypothetical protein
MNWLFEQPLIIVACGVALVLGLGAAWSASGRNELLYAAVAALVLMIAGLVAERLVITDREAIRASVLQMARDAQNNDRQAMMQHIYSGAPELRKRVDAELAKYRFTECRITKIHLIDVDAQAEPRSAIVQFNVIGSGGLRDGSMELDHVAQWVQLHLLREKEGRWTVAEYELDAPQRMIMRQPGDQ